MDITQLKGVGAVTANNLNRLSVYTVEDLGTPYGHVDIYCDSHSEALSFGLQSAEVYQLN